MSELIKCVSLFKLVGFLLFILSCGTVIPGRVLGETTFDAKIIDFNGTEGDYKWSRSDGFPAATIKMGQPLTQGDTIIISENPANNWVKINYTDGRVLSITTSLSPYTIEKSSGKKTIQYRGSRSIWENYWNILIKKLDRTRQLAKTFAGIRSSGSGPTIKIRGIGSGHRAKISVDHRLLALGWRGGVKPFRVVMKDWQGTLVFSKKNIKNHETMFHLEEPLVLGKYTITIRDKFDRSTFCEFKTVVATTFPRIILDNNFDWLAKEIVDIFEAKFLLDSDRNQFAYEAYLRLAPHRKQSKNIDTIMITMEAGLVLLAD